MKPHNARLGQPFRTPLGVIPPQTPCRRVQSYPGGQTLVYFGGTRWGAQRVPTKDLLPLNPVTSPPSVRDLVVRVAYLEGLLLSVADTGDAGMGALRNTIERVIEEDFEYRGVPRVASTAYNVGGAPELRTDIVESAWGDWKEALILEGARAIEAEHYCEKPSGGREVTAFYILRIMPDGTRQVRTHDKDDATASPITRRFSRPGELVTGG